MISRRHFLASTAAATALSGCQSTLSKALAPIEPYPQGQVQVFSDTLIDLIAPDAAIDMLADGFLWTEGPAWDKMRQKLYFSDIPNNTIHTWDKVGGIQTFLSPAGRPTTPVDPHAAPGTNGIWHEPETDTLLIANQDGRSVDRLDLKTGQRVPLTTSFDGKKLNSPNDIAPSSKGTIFFTDPPYGLTQGNDSPGKEQAKNRVYAINSDGMTRVITNKTTFPNGVALSPDERTLYVSQSDPEAALVRKLTLDEGENVISDKVWLDVTDMVSDQAPGLPDGMAIDVDGNVFVTGPGGVLVVSPKGELLGRIFTGRATANCAFGGDGSTLFMTAHDTLLSIPTKTKGVQWA